MDSIADSDRADREVRRHWFSSAHESERRRYRTLPLSTHGLLIQYDVQRAFSAGAWLSVIVLAQAAIEASVRDLGTQDYKTKPKDLFAGNETLERMRELRNEILHPQAPGSASKVWTVAGGDYVACHATLEADAKLAVQAMFKAIYAQAET